MRIDLISALKAKYVHRVMEDDSRFAVSKSEQEQILSKYSNPRDLIERSYFQFKVQAELLGKKAFLLRFGSLFILLFRFFFTRGKIDDFKKYDLVCLLAGINEDRVPDKLKLQYNTIRYHYVNGQKYFCKDDQKWFYRNVVKKYPTEFFFQLKVLERILCYSYVIKSFSPVAIANHCEYSCCSSAITKYCHDNDIKHIDFMHGEKIWYIRDSFFQFDECYVWNNHYKKIFVDLKAEPNQFIEALPSEFLVASSPDYIVKTDLEVFDYCYYLANESHDQIDIILKMLSILLVGGKTCRVRLHPRWGDHRYVETQARLRGVTVEKEGVDINDSILTTRHSISLFSTVLLQSFYNRVPILIDDISSPDRYNKLRELNYVAFSLPHELISSLIIVKGGSINV